MCCLTWMVLYCGLCLKHRNIYELNRLMKLDFFLSKFLYLLFSYISINECLKYIISKMKQKNQTPSLNKHSRHKFKYRISFDLDKKQNLYHLKKSSSSNITTFWTTIARSSTLYTIRKFIKFVLIFGVSMPGIICYHNSIILSDDGTLELCVNAEYKRVSLTRSIIWNTREIVRR